MKRQHLIGTLMLIGAFACSVRANDWPYWRGPEQTGMSREKAPVTDWSPDGKNLLWKNDIAGRSTPIIMNGRLYTIGPVGSGECLQERVVCVDANTGKLIWEHRFNNFHSDVVENRLGWNAVVGDPETGNVYAHTTGGEFVGFDRDGKVLWDRSLTEEFGRITGYGGRLHTPIVDEDRVIVSFLNSGWGKQAKPTHRYLAVNKNTGEVVYWAEPGGAPLDTTYAVPAVAVIDGKRMLIAATADGNVYGMLARTGENVWSYQLSKRGLNSSIVVDGNYAYVCHSEENYGTTKMGAIVCLDASKTGDITESGAVWRHDGYTVGYASPAIANGRLYVVTNDAELICFDAKTGEKHWSYDLGRVGKGSPTVTADGVIYVGEQTGRFHILKDEGDKCTSLSDYEFPTRGDAGVDEFYGSPSIANGRVYFQIRSGIYCLGAKDAPADTNVPIPPMPEETVATKAPAPGTAQFAARMPVELPLSIDFNDMEVGSVPPGWVGCGKKVRIDEVEGEKVFRKVADKKFPSPPFMRLTAYVTPPLQSGYTVECDMLSQAKKNRFKPDMGLVNARYLLIAIGMNKVLRLETWSALPRIREEVPFEFEPDAWYTMKFTVLLDGDQAKMMGKIWPRGQEEPTDWMITATDPCPNKEGSAGLYAYSVGTTPKSDGPETYFDNLKVYRDE
ncbi:MAG: PQQ-binding-like beta-propeller repeat protein [Phycisphaerales bacterium]|nr:PQQ-binding-like beta-propeller repeat protein [Phycisphaerales bacterium]